MSVITLTPQDTRRRNLVRIARLTIVLALLTAVPYIYLGITSHNWYNYLVTAPLILTSFVSFLISRSAHTEHPKVGAWHLLFSGSLTALVISAVQANAGAEIGSTILIINLLLSIQTLPSEKIFYGALLGVGISIACSIFAFYSPVPQSTDAITGTVIVWVARTATLAFLALIMSQFRSLNLASKLLISFLGVVVLISLTYNTVISTTTTNTLTNQIGTQLQSVAEARGLVMGDYLNGQADVLETLALDETIRQSVRAANALKPDIDSMQKLDEQWRQAVASGINDSLINSRLSNSLSNDLRAFQSISPDNIEVFVTDVNGALVSTTNVTSDYYQADEEWWQTTVQQKNAYISTPIFDESANTLSVYIAVPIYDTRLGGLIGVLRTTISMDGLIGVIDAPVGKSGESDIYFPGEKMFDTKNAEYEDINPESLGAIQESTGQVFIRTRYEGGDKILARGEVRSQAPASKVNNLGWSVIVSQNAEEALAPVAQQVRFSSLFGTIMAGIASFLSLIVAQRLANPIINLTKTADDITHGNLQARAQVDSQDEIGQLSEAFNSMTDQLQETLQGLETRVTERTAELQESSERLEKRAEQFEAIAQLARTITSIQELDALLPRIVRLISQQFGFYHVGLFLLDESRQYAVLSAANSEGGQRMLARRHRLGVGQTGIVGYVTATGNPRIALDTGTDAVYFDNPDLPDTRSEMALPLRVGRVVTGALDVQSTEPNAFTEEDVEVLSILADEVSIAIENARLYEESQRVLTDAQSAFGEFTQTAWQQMIARQKVVGYELSGTSIHTLEAPVKSNGESIQVPIKLRGRVVGAMNINLPDNKELDADDLDIAEALAQRIGIAIESATLLEETRRRAARESMVSDISAKFSATAEVDRLMQVAVKELRQILGAKEVILKVATEKEG